MARHASEPVLVPWRLGFSQQQLQLLQTPGVFFGVIGVIGVMVTYIYIYIIYMIFNIIYFMHYIFNIIYICVTRLLETKMHPISQIIGGNLRIFSKKSLRFSQLLAVWRSCLASPAWPPLTFDDGKGRRSPCISSKRASFSCNCLTNCCMKLSEIMRVWYNIYMYMYMYEVCIFRYVEIVLHTNRLYDICQPNSICFTVATLRYYLPFHCTEEFSRIACHGLS